MATTLRTVRGAPHRLFGAALTLVISHLVVSGCGPEFDSCEDSRSCPSKGGSAGSSGASGAAGVHASGGGGASSGSGGTSSGGKPNSGDAGSAGAEVIGGVRGEGEGGATGGSAAGGIAGVGGDAAGAAGAAGDASTEGGTHTGGTGGVTGGAPNGGAASGGQKATGGAVTTGGATTGGTAATGGSVSTGGAAGKGGSGTGGSGGAECTPGDTVLCGQLFGKASACADKRVACLSDGHWPTRCGGKRDCTSADDNDCDGVPDNTIDATCACASGASQLCDATPSVQDDCRFGKQLCVLREDGASSYWGACVDDPAPEFTLGRLWCPDSAPSCPACVGTSCTMRTGGLGTLQSKCAEYPSTCGYLYCM
jgi:hypothetical protein